MGDSSAGRQEDWQNRPRHRGTSGASARITVARVRIVRSRDRTSARSSRAPLPGRAWRTSSRWSRERAGWQSHTNEQPPFSGEYFVKGRSGPCASSFRCWKASAVDSGGKRVRSSRRMAPVQDPESRSPESRSMEAYLCRCCLRTEISPLRADGRLRGTGLSAVGHGRERTGRGSGAPRNNRRSPRTCWACAHDWGRGRGRGGAGAGSAWRRVRGAASQDERDPTVKAIGFALTVGVLIDAFVVRLTIVPAVLTLLGRHAWALPRWLDRAVPNVDIEGDSLPPRGPHIEVRENVLAGRDGPC